MYIRFRTYRLGHGGALIRDNLVAEGMRVGKCLICTSDLHCGNDLNGYSLQYSFRRGQNDTLCWKVPERFHHPRPVLGSNALHY